MKLTEILTQLQQPIPPDLISKKDTFSKGKKTGQVDYVAWFDLCDILDNRAGAGNWSWSVQEMLQIGNRLHLTGVLTIIGEDRNLVMMATGAEDIDCSSYGDPSSNAEAMALRRCCAKFGLGRDLWRKDKPKSSNNAVKRPSLSNKPNTNSISNSNGKSFRDWYEQGKNDALSGNEAKYSKVKPYMDGYFEAQKQKV